MCRPKWRVNYTRQKTRIVRDHETNGLVTERLFSRTIDYLLYTTTDTNTTAAGALWCVYCGKWKTKTCLMGRNFCLTVWIFFFILIFLRNRSDFRLHIAYFFLISNIGKQNTLPQCIILNNNNNNIIWSIMYYGSLVDVIIYPPTEKPKVPKKDMLPYQLYNNII